VNKHSVTIISDQKLSNLGDLAIYLSLKDRILDSGINKIYKISNSNKVIDKVEFIDFKNIIKLVKILSKSETIYMGGGGILQDESSLLNLFYYFSLSLLCFFLGKRISIISVGVTKPKFTLSKFMLKFICWNSNRISVRDKRSFELLAEFTSKNIEIVNDLVFDFKFNKDKVTPSILSKAIKGGILVAPRPLLASENESTEFCKKLAKQLDLLSEYLNQPIHLVPFQESKDLATCLTLKSYMKTEATIFNCVSPHDVYYLSQLAELVIFMRLHAGIIGYIAENKIIGIAYSSKVEHFLEEVGRHECNVAINDIDSLSSIITTMF